MKIQVEGKIYEIGDEFPSEKPKLSALIRHLENHGLESFLSSKKFGEFAPCLLEQFKAEGAQVVYGTADEPMPPSMLEPEAPVSEEFTVPSSEDDTES